MPIIKRTQTVYPHRPSKRPFDVQGYVKVDGTIVFNAEPVVITGTVSLSQVVQTMAAVGQESYLGAISTTQIRQTLSATGRESITGVVSTTQVRQTLAAAGSIGAAGLTGMVSTSQAKQTLAVAGRESYSGTAYTSQAKQTLAAIARESYAGTVLTVQARQSLAAQGQESYTGRVATSQPVQTLSATNEAPAAVTGDVATTQLAQTMGAAGSIAAPVVVVPYDPYQRQPSMVFGVFSPLKQRKRHRGDAAHSQPAHTHLAQGFVTQVVVSGVATEAAKQSTETLGRKSTYATDVQKFIQLIELLEEVA